MLGEASSSQTAGKSRAPKRSVLTAQLDADSELSSSRRAEKSQSFESRMLKTSLERRLIIAEDTRRDLERSLSDAKATIERLEDDRRWLAEREQQERQEKEELEKKWEAERHEHLLNAKSQRTSILELQTELADLKDDFEQHGRSSASTINAHASHLITARRQVEMLEDELSRARQAAQERDRTVAELRSQLESTGAFEECVSNVSMNGGLDSKEQWQIVHEELQRQKEQLRASERLNSELSSEITKYRLRNQNVEVLMEEKRSLQRKLAQVEAAKERVAMLEGELEAARVERQGWLAFLNDPSKEPSSSTPTALTQHLMSLRQSNMSLSSQLTTLTSTLQQRDADISELQRKISAFQGQVTLLEDEKQKANIRAERRAHQSSLLEREIATANALLRTFEEEESSPEMVPATHDRQLLSRIRDLESSLSQYKTVNNHLQDQLDSISLGRDPKTVARNSELTAEREARKRAEHDLSAKQSRIQELEASVANLDQKLWEAGVNISSGALTPRDTVILQMQANAASEHFALRRQELNRIKNENAALLNRIRQLETAEGGGSELVPRESWESVNAEKEELLSTVAQKEKRLLRLKQVFNAKAGEFREAVSSVLGYRLAFQSTRVRLTSAFDSTASIVFDSTSKPDQADVGTMKLISIGGDDDPSGPAALQDLMKYWVQERHSIPCFLAAVTLDRYQASTNVAHKYSSMDTQT
ncbi:spindle assembly checkpoint component Mad1 [Cantharellus anzutake]|uniref:spindle assembly checkpoint component Mad1 n=1 Tax=Cantharellus anzutake TaxID=1750568 RepID=UPI001903DA88|nr:spindle assembly checkpoint component Mad1 [Cantharellus anzutake]KAF8340553.1 spindle assembly checkpoint component Mad1 [Cantharellus anzutake]